jgi:hypothetical protein
MKNILKLINGKQIIVRPLPSLTDHAPVDLPFIGQLISVEQRSKNTRTHLFTAPKCNNTIFIGDGTAHNGKWNWYSALIINANPILQSAL